MLVHDLSLPINDDCVQTLKIGDTVYLTGIVCTARDTAHLRIKQLLDEGDVLPIDWRGSALIHAGPIAMKNENGWDLAVIGPTTSIRMEPYAEMIGNLGVKLIVGKGGMAASSLQHFSLHKQAYLQAPCGCAALLATGVKEVLNAIWLEDGMPEAMWVLRVEHFGPFIVMMDCRGHSRYDELRQSAERIITNMKN